MSFRFPFPPDPWVQREEDLALGRVNSSPRNTRTGSLEAVPSNTKTEGSGECGPTPAAPFPQKKWVFADPVAFRYLEEDPTVTVVEKRGLLRGYELYLVEQWACSRESPSLVIVTYTGDESHSVVVGVLSVPADEALWSPRLRLYTKAIQQYHARPKETELGELMVTNLSSFPSALTVIPVPDGDIRTHRQVFIVNEDLKRLGCSGRSGMALTEPTPATQAKFLQLFKTSDRQPFFDSVLELVKLCQLSLFLFGKLELEYVDGLLCDKTETAIGDWWTELGAEHYNVEPTDGILGPTTVAALLGMLMGARNRLHYLGAPVVKDVFDIDSTKRGISWFQRSYKLEKTRRLDRQTILKLHTVTAKAAAGEGWGVQKAVKSTVAEIGGKRGELVIGMVGGRDKGGIADIETLDIDKLVTFASGERAKWLWHGKARREKSAPEPSEKSSEMGTMLFGQEDASAASGKRAHSLPLEEEVQRPKDESPAFLAPSLPITAATVAEASPGEKEVLRRTVFKSVAGRVSDARTGLGRIKDTIGGGRRGHVSRPSRDDFSEAGFTSPSLSTLAQNSALVATPTAGVPRAFSWKNKPEEYLNAMKREGDQYQNNGNSLLESGQELEKAGTSEAEAEASHQSAEPPSSRMGSEWGAALSEAIREDEGEGPQASLVGSLVDTDLLGPFELERAENASARCLQRRHSTELVRPSLKSSPNEARWPRRLSFGDAAEAILRWDDIIDLQVEGPSSLDPIIALQQQASIVELAHTIYDSVYTIRSELSPWVHDKVSSVEALDTHYTQEQEDLQALYYQLSEAYQYVKQGSSELVAAERARITEAIKEVEVLIARLEYEVNALAGKVSDVEDGVLLFERQVENVESRAEELRETLETETWLHWFVRTLTGVGTGPNITRSITNISKASMSKDSMLMDSTSKSSTSKEKPAR